MVAAMAVTALPHRLGRGASGIASGKQAAAEEGAFQRAIAVHAAAAEAGCFARGVKPRHDPAVAAKDAGIEVGLEAAELLRVRMLSFTAIRGPWAGSRIRCGLAVRISRSPIYLRALWMFITCVSLT